METDNLSFSHIRKKRGNSLYNEILLGFCIPHAKKRIEVNGLLDLKSIYLREGTQILRWVICWATLRISRSSVHICTHLSTCLLITFLVSFVTKLEWAPWPCGFSFDSCFVDIILHYREKCVHADKKEFVINYLQCQRGAEISHIRWGAQRKTTTNTVRN